MKVPVGSSNPRFFKIPEIEPFRKTNRSRAMINLVLLCVFFCKLTSEYHHGLCRRTTIKSNSQWKLVEFGVALHKIDEHTQWDIYSVCIYIGFEKNWTSITRVVGGSFLFEGGVAFLFLNATPCSTCMADHDGAGSSFQWPTAAVVRRHYMLYAQTVSSEVPSGILHTHKLSAQWGLWFAWRKNVQPWTSCCGKFGASVPIARRA